nr:MAG TPA: hypothetical protein [Caudoviricetes sp.]
MRNRQVPKQKPPILLFYPRKILKIFFEGLFLL